MKTVSLKNISNRLIEYGLPPKGRILFRNNERKSTDRTFRFTRNNVYSLFTGMYFICFGIYSNEVTSLVCWNSNFSGQNYEISVSMEYGLVIFRRNSRW